MVPLNPNDKVYVKYLRMCGTVLRVRPGDVRESEEERCYEIQITRYFRRTDLELYDPEAEAKREKSLQERTARLQAARNNVERAIAAGGEVDTATAIELLHTADDLWKELGHEPVLKST